MTIRNRYEQTFKLTHTLLLKTHTFISSIHGPER